MIVRKVASCNVERELEEDVSPSQRRECVVREEVRLHARRRSCVVFRSSRISYLGKSNSLCGLTGFAEDEVLPIVVFVVVVEKLQNVGRRPRFSARRARLDRLPKMESDHIWIKQANSNQRTSLHRFPSSHLSLLQLFRSLFISFSPHSLSGRNS